MLDLLNTVLDIPAFKEMQHERKHIDCPEVAKETYALIAIQRKLTDEVFVKTVEEVEDDEINPFHFSHEELLNRRSELKDRPKVEKKRHPEIFAEVLAGKFNNKFFYAGDTDQRFLYHDGRFMPMTRNAVVTIARQYIKKKAWELDVARLTDSLWTEILHELQARTFTTIKDKPPQWWRGEPVIGSAAWQDANNVLVVGNGLLNPVAYAMGEQHFWSAKTPDLFHRFASDVDYDPNASDMPNWQKFLRDTGFTDAEKQLLQEAIACAVFPGYMGQYIILTEGIGGAGKGIVMLLVLELTGTYGMSRDIDQALRAFGQSAMQGRTVFCVPEAEAERRQLDKFISFMKKVSGRDRLESDVKFDPEFREITHHPTPFVQANELIPHLSDRCNALLRRIVPLHFTRRIQNPDPNFFEKLKPEFSAIMNWALDGFQALYCRGRFDPLPESSQDVLAVLAEQSLPLKGYFEECLQVDGDSLVSSLALYHHYENWAKENGEEPIPQNMFPKELTYTVPGLKLPKRVRVENRQLQRLPGTPTGATPKCFAGIRVKDTPDVMTLDQHRDVA